MNLEPLNTRIAAAAYSRLCFPRYRYLLADTAALQQEVIALGYFLWQQPAGLVLGEFCQSHQCVHVRSLFVLSAYRRQGIGGHLLTALAAEAKQRGYGQLDLEYPLQREAMPAVEKLLARHAWSAPQPATLLCRSDGEANIEALMQDPWMTDYSLPEDFTLFPWAELSADEFQRIAAQHAVEDDEHGHAPSCEGLAAVNSLGLRYRGEVVGWMLTKPLGGTRILYENLFIRRGLRSLGRAAVLLAESIKWHYARDGAHLCGIWRTRAANKPMAAFIKRRLGPYLSALEETRRSDKSL